MYFINLLAMILYGTLALGWVLFFTNWFPVVGGLLGLGGLFAWLAFLGNVVSDNRKEELQKFFDEKCLQRFWFFIVATLVFILFVALMPLSQGSIVFDNSGTERTWRVDMYPLDDAETITTTVIPARTVITQTIPVNFLGDRTYRLEVGDLPWLNQEVVAFSRDKQLRLPDDFMRRGAILIRPHAKTLKAIATRRWHLEVIIKDAEDKKVRRIADYTGKASYWLGVSERVRAPASLELDWRVELKGNDHTDSYIESWSNPLSISAEPLPHGATVCAVLIDPKAEQGSAVMYGGSAVLMPAIDGRFVTTLTLKYKGATKCLEN